MLVPEKVRNVSRSPRADQEIVQSVNNGHRAIVGRVVMGSREATAAFASAQVGRLSTRRFSSVEKLPPGMYVDGTDALSLAAADVGIP